MDFGRISVNIPQLATSTPKTFEDNIQSLLKQKLSADDSSGIQERKQNLLKEFDSLSGTDAKALYDRLKSRQSGDETSELFHDRLADATCNQLLKVLQKKFSSNEIQTNDTSGADQTANPGGIAAEKTAQIQLEGKLAQREFLQMPHTGRAGRAVSAGGGTDNGLQMQDSGGSQGFNIRSSKDQVTKGIPDKTEEVGVDDSHSVKIQSAVIQQPSEEVPLVIPEHGSNEDPGVMERRGSIKTAPNPGKPSTNDIKMDDAGGKQETFVKPKG